MDRSEPATDSLQPLISAKHVVIGPNVQIDSPMLVELIAASGFDYIMLDGEHGVVMRSLPELIIAANGAGAPVIVRVPSLERSAFLLALECGAAAVQVPMVDTAEMARQAVEWCKYPPVGGRGFSLATRAARYGVATAAEHSRRADERMMVFAQIETPRALENIDEIAAVDGLDGLFFGPGDLSAAMRTGDGKSSGERGANRETGTAVRRAIVGAMQSVGLDRPDLVLSTSVFSGDDVRFWFAQGIRFFLTSSVSTMQRAFASLHRELCAGVEAEGSGARE